MRYVRKDDVDRQLQATLDKVGSISATGSVQGMRKLYGWPKDGQIRVGSYIYNVGPSVVASLAARGILRG